MAMSELELKNENLSEAILGLYPAEGGTPQYLVGLKLGDFGCTLTPDSAEAIAKGLIETAQLARQKEALEG